MYVCRLGDREQIEREYIAVMKEYDTIFDDIQHHKSLIQVHVQCKYNIFVYSLYVCKALKKCIQSTQP